jgi:RHS repeat-associated protein
VLAVVSDKKLSNNQSDIKATYDYYPFGMQMPNRSLSGDYRYGFGGHEKDFEIHSGWYGFGDYGYDSRTGRRPTPDPVDQIHISNYAAFGNNSLFYVDPDGKRLVYAQGFSQEFQNNVILTIQYMDKKGTSSIIRKIMSHPETITIAEYSGNSYFDPNTNTIYWNTTMGVLTDEFVFMSPATVLNHEADHVLQGLENPEQKRTDKKTADKYYENNEEKRVITGSEQETARKHGEINKDEVTRKNHNGSAYETISPITTQGKDEIVVSPAKQEEKTKEKTK